MSRRKQSNPKPLKREDEEDSPTPEALDKPSEPPSTRTKSLSNSERSPSIPPSSPGSSGCESPAPRLRLNASLATDPALRSEAMTVKTEVASPNSEVNSVRGPSAAELEYLASIPSAFQHALATAGRLFPTTPLPEGDALNLPKSRNKQEPPAVVIESRAVPVFMCTPCGIRFSSASTLEAHQTYYCSHRVQMKGRGDSDGDDPKSPQNANEDGETPGKVVRTGKQYGCPHCSYSADKKVSLNRHMRMHSSSPAAPISLPVPVILPSPLQNGVEQPTANQSQLVDRYCQDCDIRFYSVKTLKAHKMHYCSSRYAKGSPNSKNSSTPTSPSDAQRLSPEPSHQRPGRGNEQPFLILRTNPILIVPYSLLQSASVFTGSSPNLPSQDTPCILMPNGTLQPMSNLVAQLANDKDYPRNSNHVSRQKTGEESPPVKSAKLKADATPLDLSVRRSSESSDLVIDMEDEKENVFTSSPHQEDVAPSMSSLYGRAATPDKRSEERKQSESYSSTPSPNLPPSPSSKKSPRRTPNGISSGGKSREGKKADVDFQTFGVDLASRRGSMGGKPPGPLPLLPSQLPLLLPGASSDLFNQASLLPLLSTDLRIPGLVGPQTITESSLPQVLVKQGVSKCQECNIVFCKHENYIAHKKHYCSSRLPELSSDESSRTSPVISKSPGSGSQTKDSSAENSKVQAGTPPSLKAQPLQYQFICVACSISFTSLDNLTTHQTYYCTKRTADSLKSVDEKGRRCGKCKAIVNGDHQCVGPCLNPVVTGWKCPCCDVVSPTAAAAQKHMDTHQGVRAFRCTICKYKGNTLRGMRTHIRVHFDKKNSDLQEENFISCILDEESEQQQAAQPPLQPQIQNNGLIDSARGSQVTVKVEAEEEFVEVDVVEPQFQAQEPGDAGDEEDKCQNSNNNKKINYCKSCDISFNYLSSLIAHKKFYCSASSVESEVQSKSPRTTPETSVHKAEGDDSKDTTRDSYRIPQTSNNSATAAFVQLTVCTGFLLDWFHVSTDHL